MVMAAFSAADGLFPARQEVPASLPPADYDRQLRIGVLFHQPNVEPAVSGELKAYRSKRNFTATPEPRGKQARAKAAMPLRYLIQRHAAIRLHYDFRIEHHGVLKSWAVTKSRTRNDSVWGQALAMRRVRV